MTNNRVIFHLDMDCYFAQVEMRDNPKLKDELVAVAHDHNRGVICTSNYLARKKNIHSGMSVASAKKICPELKFIPPNMEKYKQVSEQIRNIISEYSDFIEPVGLDECYIDVTFNKKGQQDFLLLAKEIKQKIAQQVHLTCSIGIAKNKFLAKIGSDYQKPNGITIIDDNNQDEILNNLKISDFLGIGKQNLIKAHDFGIYRGADIRRYELDQLQLIFGEKAGRRLYNQVRGEDDSVVEFAREPKSISFERTLPIDISEEYKVRQILGEYAQAIEKRLIEKNLMTKTITVRIKFADFTHITRAKTTGEYYVQASEIALIASQIIKTMKLEKPIRLVGLSVSNLKTVNASQLKYRQSQLPILYKEENE